MKLYKSSWFSIQPTFLWYRYLIFLLLISGFQDSFATSKYYLFEGKLTGIYDPYTRTAINAGYEIGDLIHYVVEMDFERQGYYISPVSGSRITPDDTATDDYFYANLIRGTEIIHIGTPGVVYDNLGVNKTDPNQSNIGLANYLVLKNGINPIDWKIGDEVISSDRWTLQGNEHMEGSLILRKILDTSPPIESSLNNWARLLFDREITNLIRQQPINNTIFASGRPYGGLYEKINNGSLFVLRTPGLVYTNIKDLAFSPDSVSTMYIATLQGGILMTTDGGVNWIQSNNGIGLRSNFSTDAYSVAVSPSNPSMLYAGTLFGLYISADSGNNWQQENAPFNDKVIKIIRITGNNEVFVGTDAGVFAGSVDGNSWKNLLDYTTSIYNKSANVTDIKLHPADPDIIAIGLQGIGAFLYHINSGTWERLKIGPASSSDKFVVNFAGASGEIIYMASQSGLFRSDDGNQSWDKVVLPIVDSNDVSVNEFIVDSNEKLTIASNHNGTYAVEKTDRKTVPYNNFVDTTATQSGGGGSVDPLVLLVVALLWTIRIQWVRIRYV